MKPLNSTSGVLLLAVLVLASAPLWGRLEPNEYVGGRSRNAADRVERNASAIASEVLASRLIFSTPSSHNN